MKKFGAQLTNPPGCFISFVVFIALVTQQTDGRISFQTQSNNLDDMNFYTYPKPYEPHRITLGDKSTLQNSGLVPGTKLTVIIHVHNTGWTTAPLNAYLKQGFKNVLWVDWEKLSSPLPDVPSYLAVVAYPGTLQNVPKVGKRTADVISFLIKNQIISGPEMVHFVGWSTGAHVAATAARYLKKEYSRVVLRITGLDPVGPLSYFLGKNRLSKDKASFVDVMHTSNLLLGTAESMGHVDFFINGGLAVKQPGCPTSDLTDGKLNQYFLCAPRLAITLYAQTINPAKVINGCKCKPFPANEKAVVCKKLGDGCQDKTLMGEYTPIGTRGNYYVTVKTNPGPDN